MHRLADDSLVEACCLSDDGEGVLLGGQGKRLNLWDVATGECLQAFDVPFHARGTGVKFVAFCGSEVLALLSGWGGRIEMWEMISGKRLQVFEGESTFATAASLSCNGAFMISGYWTGVVRLWDVSSGKCLWKIGPHPDMVTAVCISADCRLALSSSLPLPRNRRSDTTNTLLVSDIVTGRCVQDFGGYGAGVATAVLSPTNDLVLAPGYDGGLRALSVAEGKSVGTFQGQAGAVTAIGLTPDTKYALTGSSTGALCLWRISTGRCISAWQGHTGEVDVVKLSIDGLRAISFGRDRYLRGWGLEWKLQARRSADWHESARPYVEIFLTLHTPHAPDGISREGKPFWTEDDFHGLITDLQYRGYGWLRPEGVRRKLEEMSASWHGPPPLFWDTP
jgi:WD40 repeat protein